MVELITDLVSQGSSELLILPLRQEFVMVLLTSGGSDGKESKSQCRRSGFDLCFQKTPTLTPNPGEGNGYPLQYCCLENSMDREAWQVPGVSKSQHLK